MRHAGVRALLAHRAMGFQDRRAVIHDAGQIGIGEADSVRMACCAEPRPVQAFRPCRKRIRAARLDRRGPNGSE